MTATPASRFYSTSLLAAPFDRADVLAGRVIRISPALITITDGRIGTASPDALRRDVLDHVDALLAGGIRSLHVDVNFDDYGGFDTGGPDRNAAVFTPAFVAELVDLAGSYGGAVTLHLLSDQPERHLPDYAHSPLGAVCFQLDAITTGSAAPAHRLAALVAQIRAMGACASPVIETVGTGQRAAPPPEAVRALLELVLPQIGMLTLQAAGTAARSNLPAGTFARERVAAYLACLRPGFGGTVQIQGGITIGTAGAAVALGAEFLVAGTQLFRCRDGRTTQQVIDAMHAVAAGVLCG